MAPRNVLDYVAHVSKLIMDEVLPGCAGVGTIKQDEPNENPIKKDE